LIAHCVNAQVVCLSLRFVIGDQAAFRKLSNTENLTQPQFRHPCSIPSEVYSDDTESVEAVAMGGEDTGVTPENKILQPDTTA
jgi:hypothetical protein